MTRDDIAEHGADTIAARPSDGPTVVRVLVSDWALSLRQTASKKRERVVTKLVLEDVRVKDIEAFAQRETKAAPWGATIPISVSRAHAWANNPHADPEDVVLIVGRIDGYCAGYIGLVPALLQIHERVERIDWVSTFFVPPELRKRAVGYYLGRRTSRLGRPLAVVEPTRVARQFCLAARFKPLRTLTYFELDLLRGRNWLGLPLRAVRRILLDRKRRVPGSVDAAIAECGRPTAYLLLSWLLSIVQHKLGRWRITRLDQLPVDANPATAGDVHFVRDRAVLEWMLRYPWVTTTRADKSAAYFFDDYRDESFHRVYQIREAEDSEAQGWAIVWFTVRAQQRALHILDYELHTPRASSALLTLALREARKHRANRICIPNVCDLDLQRLGRVGRLFSKKTRRFFLRPSDESITGTIVEDLCVSYADGDLGFA